MNRGKVDLDVVRPCIQQICIKPLTEIAVQKVTICNIQFYERLVQTNNFFIV